MTDDDVRCITTQQLHELTGISLGTLRQWRSKRRGPASFRAGGVVLYRLSVVHQWLADQEAAEEERAS